MILTFNLILQSKNTIIRNTLFNTKNVYVAPIFTCFIWASQPTAIISLNSNENECCQEGRSDILMLFT